MPTFQNEFIKQLSMAVLGTMLFMANCAFILIPSALGSTPGRPLEARVAAIPMAQSPTDAIGTLAMAENGRLDN